MADSTLPEIAREIERAALHRLETAARRSPGTVCDTAEAATPRDENRPSVFVIEPDPVSVELLTAALAAILAAAPVGAGAAVRNIATVEVDTWFDASYRAKAEDVLLVRLLPSFTLQAQAIREDLPGWCGWQFVVGPVVNLTQNLYLVAVYGLGIDSDGAFSHELDASRNHETAGTDLSLGVKADWFPSTGYFYAMLGGKFNPVPALGLFGKAVVAVDRYGQASGSFWGEADWSVSRVISPRAGGTMGYSSAFGWSAIAGVNMAITPKILVKYTLKYLAEPIDTMPDSPIRKGIENGLVVDVRC